MSLPNVVSREEWNEARTQFLADEKAFTRARDELVSRRRELPMVLVEKDYHFEGPEGTVSLLDLFHGKRQLIVSHFMFAPEWEKGCSGCTAGHDELSPGLIEHLRARDTEIVVVSRAPLAKLEQYKADRGWDFAWYSSNGSDFNYDFHVSLDQEHEPMVYNYRPDPEGGEGPGVSTFLRDGDQVFHTYSTFARGTEQTGGSYYFLDLTALGRQEEWELPKGRSEKVWGADPSFGT
jgi:predicted dithiol-disulfide oxidoreductase (DUF899 family)